MSSATFLRGKWSEIEMAYESRRCKCDLPFVHGSQKYTHAYKTEALLQASIAGGYDAFGGARRDEEKSRAKSVSILFEINLIV